MSLNIPVFVSKVEDFDGLKKCQKIKFYCRQCGELTERLFMRSRLEACSTFCCHECNKKKTYLEKYGVDNPAKSKKIMSKIQNTNLERYGNVCSLNGKDQIEKKRNTWQKNFGKSNPFQKDEVKEKVRKNNIEKYGSENAFCLEQFREKSYNTRIKKYGSLRTCYLYKLDNFNFDSMWEIYFYIFCRDQDCKIERETTIFEYYIGTQKHRYYVDFKIDNKLYEIKSSYYLERTSKEKLECMKNNNVILISDNEIKKYRKYCIENYPNLNESIIRIKKNENGG